MKMQIDLPSNAFIKSATLLTVEAGLSRGTLALELKLSGTGILGKDFGAVVSRILEVDLPKALPLIRLCGQVDQADDFEVLSFIDALTSYKKIIHIVTTGQRWKIWMKNAPWIILTTSEPTIIVPANEIHYAPTTSEIVDINFAGGEALRSAYTYLDVSNLRIPPQELLNFLYSSKFAWSII